ncbi:hypothetical protein [uncultured Methylobacterium sp.]|uniref:hypothetical protein n=1 Tax=uncultured Methylobacterium sp. TaxID=157278 RepID=UPI0035CC38FD
MRTIIAAVMLACIGTQLAAQGSASPDAAPSTAPIDPKPDRTRNLAAKLAGLVGFANTSCPDVRGDPDLLRTAVRRLGLDPDDLDRGELALIVRSYMETYGKNVPENCKRAIETFGPSSVLVPNLIVKR